MRLPGRVVLFRLRHCQSVSERKRRDKRAFYDAVMHTTTPKKDIYLDALYGWIDLKMTRLGVTYHGRYK